MCEQPEADKEQADKQDGQEYGVDLPGCLGSGPGLQVAEADPVGLDERDDLRVRDFVGRDQVSRRRFQGLIEDICLSVLLDLLKAAEPDVTINRSSRQAFSRGVFGDRDKEVMIIVQESLGLDGADRLGVNGCRGCLKHNGNPVNG